MSEEMVCPLCLGPTKGSCSGCGLSLEPDGIWRPLCPERRELSYPEHGNEACAEIEARSFWFRHRNRVIASVVGRYPPAGVLWDVGGGNGFVAEHLASSGFPTAVLEPGGVGCANARARGVESVVCSAIEDLEVSGVMPAVGLFDVLEHLEDAGRVLEQIRRLLVPRGRLYLTVPSYQLLWSQRDVDAGHRRRYRRETLELELLAAGFGVLQSSYFFLPLLLPMLVSRRLLRARASGTSEGVLPASVSRAVELLLQGEILAMGLHPIPWGCSLITVCEKV
jgi:SAM-dependent methyltransferase